MKNGKFWVIGMLALGAAAGLIAVYYWKTPSAAVRQTFTLFHSLLVRKKHDTAALLVSGTAVLDGRVLGREAFVRAYGLPDESGLIEVDACGRTPGHWQVAMLERAYCFLEEGSGWRLHWVGPAPCACAGNEKGRP